MKEYEAKAKGQWGNTAQYEQYEEKRAVCPMMKKQRQQEIYDDIR